jgi:hypothetical protein
MDFTPHGVKNRNVKRHIGAFVRRLARADDRSEESLESLRAAHMVRLRILPPRERVDAEAAINVFADLAKQGWSFAMPNGEIKGVAPALGAADDVRDTRRRQLSARRHEQLRQPTHREFIAHMESGHLFKSQVVSIFNLMRDGRELAQALISGIDQNAQALIKPYLQFVAKDDVCRFTGFRLQDIWRYFRHTWASAYESVPGRSFLILVRDGGAPFHPVMGIAALASAASVLPVRDKNFIGWSADSFLQHCRETPRNEVAQWVIETVQSAIKDIYRTDFIAQGLLPLRVLQKDIPRITALLRRHAAAAKQRHIQQSEGREHKSTGVVRRVADDDWEAQARTDLFRSKRAIQLASLLEIQSTINIAYYRRRGIDRLRSLCDTDIGRDALKKVVRIARSRSIGTAIADLVVCGAVAPYNEILGGKLVAALAASPEVVRHYRRRYGGLPSVIASSMAGRRIVRQANLVYVGTTSLYGKRPSQYDRIKVPIDRLGGKHGNFITYQYLGDTAGLGTAQFGYATIKALETALRRSNGGFRRVNNVFGEGANPKFRALRDGIANLGFSADLMMHGLTKSVYGVGLIENLRDYLLGIDKTPKYIFPLTSEMQATAKIAEWWYERWVRTRCARPDIADRLARHTLVRPISHGARVVLPSIELS